MGFLKHQSIYVLDRKNNGIFLIPDGDALLSIEILLEGLKWTYKEFIDDCKKYRDPQTTFNDNEFITRNTTRTIAYANHACLLEGLIRKTYNQALASIQEKISLKISNLNELKSQKMAFKSIETFRHKVSAHLSYAFPKNDNTSVQLTSLQAILSCAFKENDVTSFMLGALQIICGKENPNIEIPPLNIKSTHEFLMLHYEKWSEIFNKILADASKYLPIKNNEREITLR